MLYREKISAPKVVDSLGFYYSYFTNGIPMGSVCKSFLKVFEMEGFKGDSEKNVFLLHLKSIF